jgi:hypothetical protein
MAMFTINNDASALHSDAFLYVARASHAGVTAETLASYVTPANNAD